MSRLSAEFQRLYLPAQNRSADLALEQASPFDAQGRLRLAVLGLVDPAEWAPLAEVWQDVQTGLGLPAPAIAIDGRRGLQLWFSLQQPQPVARLQAFLQGLCRRHLAGLPAHRVLCLPGAADGVADLGNPATWRALLPAREQTPEHWSAIVAQDLAPLFAETPWLDLPPGDEAQASQLARLQSIGTAQFEAALRQLAPPAEPLADAQPDVPAPQRPQAPASAAQVEAQRFLLGVMNDGSAPLALRIEAAKALLAGQPLSPR